MKSILVTGGAGFIGSHLIKALLERFPDCKVVSLDNYYTGSEKNHVDALNVTYINGSVVDIHRHIDFVPDVVFHLGGYSRLNPSFEELDACYEFNIVGTFKVARFCAEKGVRLVYAGSSSKLGSPEFENLSPYAWTKSKNVELLHNYNKWLDGLDYAVAYFFNVYGEKYNIREDYATLVDTFQGQVARGEELTVVSPGTQLRDYTYVGDIVNGLILIAQAEGVGKEYFIRCGKSYSILDIAQAFDHPYRMVPSRKGDRMFVGDVASQELFDMGWKPSMDVIDYIRNWKLNYTNIQ